MRSKGIVNGHSSFVVVVLTSLKSIIRLKTPTHQLAAAEDQHHPGSVRHHDVRFAVFPAHLVVELVVGIRRFLAFEVDLQVTIRATGNEVCNRSYLTYVIY